jgi:hypothetical protein
MVERTENAAWQPDYLSYLLRLWRPEGNADAWRKPSVASPNRMVAPICIAMTQVPVPLPLSEPGPYRVGAREDDLVLFGRSSMTISPKAPHDLVPYCDVTFSHYG